MSPLPPIGFFGGVTAAGDYESIATVTVGSGGASSISFSSISSGYKHLQLRYAAMTTRATYGYDAMTMQVNSDSTSGNYSWHVLRGSGAAATAGGGSDNQWYLDFGFGTTAIGAPAAGIIDILDYANTSKAKTMRALYGEDLNGTPASAPGRINLISGGYYSSGNPAISSISFTSYNGNNIAEYSSFALYGIKG